MGNSDKRQQAVRKRSLLCSILLAVILSVFFSCLAEKAWSEDAGATEVRAGSELEFPPYAFVDENGRPAGFSVDLIRAVAAEMGLNIRISTGQWDTVWNDLTAGRLDVLPLVANMPARRQLVDFGIPHTETYDAFFVRRGDNPVRNIAEARGREIVVMRSDAAHHALLERHFQGKLVLVDTIPEGLSLISAGLHDALLCSKLIGSLEIKKKGIKGLKAGSPIPDYKREFSFAVKKGDAELLEMLNQGLMIVKTNGVYERLYEKWLTVDDPWRTIEKYLYPAAAAVLAIVLLSGVWVLTLQMQVRKRTRELAATNAMLSQARKELEARVEQRTEELSRANEALQNEIAERRQAEERTRHLASFPHLNPNPVLETDASGAIIYVNPGAQKILQELGMDINDAHAFLPSDFTDILQAMEKKEDETFYREVSIKGRFYSSTVHISPQFNVVRIYAYDNTERIEAEEALRRAKEDWEKTFNSVPDMIAIMDNDYRIVRVNRSMADRLGLTMEQCIGKSCYEVVHGMEDAPDFCPLMQTLRDAKEHTVEAYEPRFDGYFLVSTSPMFDEQGRLAGSVHVARDITALKRAEKALRMSEEQLKRAQEMSNLGSWELDVVNNTLVWSDEVYRIFGLQPREFGATYEAFLEAVHPDDRQAVDDAYSSSLREGRDAYEIEHRVVRKSTGEVRVVHEKCEHKRDESGRVVASRGMVHDITDRKRDEDSIRTALEEKELLLREIHHRVKNNMTVIFSLLKLQSRHVNDERDRVLFDDSMARIKSMALIHEKLYRSKNIAEVNFSDYIKDLTNSIFMSYRIPCEKIALKIDVDSVFLGIDTAIPCGLIVNELISNAMKHAFPDDTEGEIKVSLKEFEGPAPANDDLQEKRPPRRPVIELTVSDNGAGLPEGTDIRRSRSLGMNIIDALVKQIHGKIDIISGHGTEFRVRFTQ